MQLFSLIKIWAYDKTWWNLSTWKTLETAHTHKRKKERNKPQNVPRTKRSRNAIQKSKERTMWKICVLDVYFVASVKYIQMRNKRINETREMKRRKKNGVEKEKKKEKNAREKPVWITYSRSFKSACSPIEYSFRADLVGIFVEIVRVLSSQYQVRLQSN